MHFPVLLGIGAINLLVSWPCIHLSVGLDLRILILLLVSDFYQNKYFLSESLLERFINCLLGGSSMVRWGVVVFIGLILISTVQAHKSPIVEYGQSGVWRTEYSFIPRQPVVNEEIMITERVSHLNGTIEGNVTMVFSVYQDDSVNDWYAGKQYKNHKWLLIKSAPGEPIGDNKFMMKVIIDRPGNYMVTVDMYEDGQYIGQDIRAVDVEQRTLGPLFLVFSGVIITAVLIGVKRKVL